MSDGSLNFDTKIDSSGVDRGVRSLKSTFDSLINSVRGAGNSTNKAFNNTSGIDKSNSRVKALVDEVDILKDRLYSLERQGLYFGDGNYDETYSKLNQVENELNKYKKSLSQVGNQETKTAKKTDTHNKSLKKMSKSSDKAKKATSGLSKTLGMLRMSMVMAVAFMAFQKVMEGIGEGINNLAKYSTDFNKTMSSLKSAMTQFKNSIATAFAPIMSVAIPYLVTFINYLSKALTTFGQFVAALSGKKTFTQAKAVQEDYAKSLDDTTDSAKKTAKALYDFDELNTVQTNEDTTKDDGNADVSQMFDTVSISDKISTMAQKFKEVLSVLFEPIKSAWDTYGNGVMTSFYNSLNSIWTLIKSIGTSFMEVWTNGTGQETVGNILILLTTALTILGAIATAFTLAWNDNGAGTALIQSIFDMFNAILVLINSIGVAFLAVWTNGTGQQTLGFILSIVTNIFDIVTNLVTQFTTAWNSAGTGQQIFQNIADVINTLLSYVDKITVAMVEWAGNIDFSPLLQSFEKLTASLEPLAGNIGEALYWFFTEVLLPIADWVITDVAPLFFEGLANAITLVNTVVEALQPLASWLWENFLQPLAEWTGGVIVDVLSALVDGLKGISDWISKHQKLVEGFVIVVLSFMAAWKIVNVALIIGQIVTALVAFVASGGLATVVATALGVAIAFLTSPIGLVVIAIGVLIAIVVLLIRNWDAIAKAALDAWNGLVKAWKESDKWVMDNVYKPIAEAFTKLWKIVVEKAGEAWEGIKTAFKDVGEWFMDSVIDPIVKAFEWLWQGIKNIVNGILKMIENFINAIISGINFMVDAINSIHFDIPKWVPIVGGSSVGFSLPKVSKVSLPKLATGTVVPPTSGEFAAILGDNNRETEVVSPLSTMKQALKEALAESNIGGGNGGNTTINMQVDGKTFAQIVLPYLSNENSRVGVSLVQGGVS